MSKSNITPFDFGRASLQYYSAVKYLGVNWITFMFPFFTHKIILICGTGLFLIVCGTPHFKTLLHTTTKSFLLNLQSGTSFAARLNSPRTIINT